MVNSTGRFTCILNFALRFVLGFSSSFSIAITSLVERKAGLCALRAFICFARVDLYLFPLPLSVRDWLQLVIVALPFLFTFLTCGKLLQGLYYMSANSKDSGETALMRRFA